jgi:drug/metabolite transporter (DMT)-like permease
MLIRLLLQVCLGVVLAVEPEVSTCPAGVKCVSLVQSRKTKQKIANFSQLLGNEDAMDPPGDNFESAAHAAQDTEALSSYLSLQDYRPFLVALFIALAISGAGLLINWYAPDFLGYFACVIYMALSVSIDLSIGLLKNPESSDATYSFSPTCSVLLTETIKLVITIALLGCVSLTKKTQGGVHEPAAVLTCSDVQWLCVPSAIFTINNILVWWAIGKNELSTFGVFRDTMILWTAVIWRFVFKTPLGNIRLLGILTVFAGLLVNRLGGLSGQSALNFGVLLILLMTMVNALGSVANEYAMKRNVELDINWQNLVVYIGCVSFTFAWLVVTEPGRLQSRSAFFEGLTSSTFFVISLQAFAGLMVSRIIKYADSVAKSVATCGRGPLLVLVAPFFTKSDQSLPTVLSAFVLAGGCFKYLSQGRLRVSSPDK